MTGGDYKHSNIAMIESQDPAFLNQPAAVQNTWYPILPATRNVEVYDLLINMAVANETLELRVIVDGITIVGTIAAVFNTGYRAGIEVNVIAQTMVFSMAPDTTNYEHVANRPLIKGHTVQIDIRKTTANGANTLQGACFYGILKKTSA